MMIGQWTGGKGDRSRVSDRETYRDNHDNIFGKKTGHEWLVKLYPGGIIYDADGWRGDDGVTLDTKITRNEFERRLQHCTVNLPSFFTQDEQ